MLVNVLLKVRCQPFAESKLGIWPV